MATTTVYGTITNASIEDKVSSKSTNIIGLGFPIGKLSGGGFFYKVANLALLKQNLTQFLSTKKGERVMLPTFGLNLYPYLFQPLDEDLVENIQYEIVSQIKKFFPNLIILKLRVLETSNINYLGGQGLKIQLDLLSTSLNNTTFTVGTTIS